MYIYIYIYTYVCTYIYIYILIDGRSRGTGCEYLSTGYGLRFSVEIYGNNREKTVFNESLQKVARTVLQSPAKQPVWLFGGSMLEAL